LNWILRQKENFFKIWAPYTVSLPSKISKISFKNSKSARFRTKFLARHHFEEKIPFWSKNEV